MPAIAVLAAAAAAWCFFLQVDSRHLDALAGGAALNNANFLDNDQWLSTVSQYDRDKYWNRFRDLFYTRKDWNVFLGVQAPWYMLAKLFSKTRSNSK
ncbi:Testican-1 [Microtus ochrogaster]|uniref:Testican-1 n=1 Tax=Microtus ochrogaster TaxID=79684 RepID=A0A8J6KM56_MICOH|nr:Testican-1 [Microtus ochrogaster]